MPRQLIALPVNQGDAFFFRSGKRRVLVDGGGNKAQLLQLLTQVIGASGYVDAAICTHADFDHANGLLGLFLPGSTIKVREVWLPGQWLARPDLLTHPGVFFDELFNDTAQAQFNDEDDLERQGGELSSQETFEERNSDRGDELNAPELEEILDQASRRGGLPQSPFYWPFWDYVLHLPYSTPSHAQRFALVADIAQRIRELLVGAYQHGARIRLFDFSAFKRVGVPSGGWPGEFEPVNSREDRPKSGRSLSALDYLRLTVSNRESLVFWAPEQANAPGALFCADSDLGFGMKLKVPSRAPAVTAPHHGAESNASAYTELKNWAASAPGVTWVRSDRLRTQRPGPTFRSLSQPRFCTRCRPPNVSTQEVRLDVRTGHWQPARGVSGCAC